MRKFFSRSGETFDHVGTCSNWWKIERVPSQFVDLAKEVSRQNVENANGVSFSSYDKEWEERAELNN